MAAVATVLGSGCTAGSQAAAPDARACRDLAVTQARTPPAVDAGRPAMGWDPFNTFGVTIDQSLIVSTVRAMAADGMRAAGYHYIVLDDGWQGPRTAGGQLTADPRRFPCGMERLAAFIHAMGFDVGIYTTPAARSCSGRTGSAGHVRADARTLARWGVDYLKLDWCGADYSPASAAAIARTWRAALSATHRQMILSINAGGSPSVGPWARTIVTSWRVGGDICGSWYNQSQPPSATARRCYDRVYHEGIFDYLTSPGVQAQAALAGPGHYIDPDMLEVGTASESADGHDLAVPALDPAEAMTNFAIWAMWSAPLIAGNDPRTMGAGDGRNILLNREIISIDQDPLGRPATLALSQGSWQVWRKPLAGGRAAVAIVNLAGQPEAATFSWAQAGIGARPASISDAWSNRPIPPGAAVRVRLGAHATAIYLLGG